MLLPRYALPEPRPVDFVDADDPDPCDAHHPQLLGLDGRARQRLQTIDDPVTRADLASMLDEAPFAFLSFAARTIALHGMATPALVRDLIRAGYGEGVALAAALWWLCGLRPPDVLLEIGLPSWLVSLGDHRTTAARRRREGLDEAVHSYLLEVELTGGWTGTLHVQLDQFFCRAVVHGFAADQSLTETLALFRAAARWRHRNGLDVPAATPFRAVGVERTLETLAGPLRDAERVDVPINLHSPWPGIRTLLVFFVADRADDDLRLDI